MPSFRSSISFALLVVPGLGIVACTSQAHRDPVLGQAYVGPANLNLRKEIAPKSQVVATVHFGEKVEIIGARRRFVRVRTKTGVEGWTDDRVLLAQADVDQIKAQSAAAKAYPSQGISSTYDALNVHAQPTLLSPSYVQIKEGEKFDVLEHRLVKTLSAAPRKQLIPPPEKKVARKKENKAKTPPPPSPLPPALPLDWLELSKTRDDDPPKPQEPPPATPEDDWSLVRTSSGQSGWVLTRRLVMSIPDEVAQYAEGRRITSYFSLGKTKDQDVVKDVWLWTTVESAKQPYDFDGFRVFVWSLRHHRYETALIQRRVIGYFPTLVDGSGKFAVCIEKSDGRRYRRSYQLVENVIKFAGEKPWEDTPVAAASTPAAASPEKPSAGAIEKLKGKLKSIIKK